MKGQKADLLQVERADLRKMEQAGFFRETGALLGPGKAHHYAPRATEPGKEEVRDKEAKGTKVNAL